MKNLMDYRALLVKYVAHVVAAEGPSFAGNAKGIAPCDMGHFEFTPEELRELNDVIFPEVTHEKK